MGSLYLTWFKPIWKWFLLLLFIYSRLWTFPNSCGLTFPAFRCLCNWESRKINEINAVAGSKCSGQQRQRRSCPKSKLEIRLLRRSEPLSIAVRMAERLLAAALALMTPPMNFQEQRSEIPAVHETLFIFVPPTMEDNYSDSEASQRKWKENRRANPKWFLSSFVRLPSKLFISKD